MFSESCSGDAVLNVMEIEFVVQKVEQCVHLNGNDFRTCTVKCILTVLLPG